MYKDMDKNLVEQCLYELFLYVAALISDLLTLLSQLIYQITSLYCTRETSLIDC